MSEILYQIFPDRFANGDPANNPRTGAWKWRGRPIRFSRVWRLLARNPSDQYTFFGGDLAGIRQKLPYLADLGVTGLYLNPIFAARSTHRYDTIDYRRIDPSLGTRGDFEALAAGLAAARMKLFLDGVFNHTSDDHPWHRDARKRRRFYLMEKGEKAMSWMGRGTLPKLNPERPEVARALLDVLEAWPEVDGWRLDAAHLLPRAFLKRMKKKLGRKTVIVEDWMEAGHYFREGLADGVTNFLFREALRTFFIEDLSPENLLLRLSHWIENYPSRAVQSSWNFLENHDTPRFASLVPPHRLRLAYLLLFTLPGTPVLFQGGEFGMKGDSPAESRAPVEWDPKRQDQDLNAHIRLLIRLRRENAVLSKGDFLPLFASNERRSFAFARGRGKQQAVVAVNDGYRSARLRAGGCAFRLPPGGWEIRLGSQVFKGAGPG